MKTKVVRHTFALLLIAAMSFAAEQTFDFSPGGRFILHGPSSRKLFDQCSRAAPPSRSELWEPSGKDIDDLEVLLAKYLTERDKAGKTTPPKGTKYHRQYTDLFKTVSDLFTVISILLEKGSEDMNRGNRSRFAMADMSSGESCTASRPRPSKGWRSTA